jgi:hypothetical protein
LVAEVLRETLIHRLSDGKATALRSTINTTGRASRRGELTPIANLLAIDVQRRRLPS